MEGWTGADTFYSSLTLGVIHKLRSLKGIQVRYLQGLDYGQYIEEHLKDNTQTPSFDYS